MKVDQLIRTKRRTIAIIVRRDGKVIVRAPLRAAQKDIDRFVAEKTAWIEQKLAEFRRAPQPQAARTFTPGETFLYLGQAYPLVLTDRARPTLAFEQSQFRLARAAQANARALFEQWYKIQARAFLTARVNEYARRYNLKYDRLRISSARTRWGSCSSKGTLSFTWRLIMAPVGVVDYVIIHELAHLTVPNHSKAFWERVGSLMPDYKERLTWLKKNGRMLNID